MIGTGNCCHIRCDRKIKLKNYHTAVRNTDSEALRFVINEGANLCRCVCNRTTGEGLLHTAVPSRCFQCVNLLRGLPFNCPCDDRDHAGNTPLHTAARICRLEMVDNLIQQGCNVNAVNNAGNTPLCLASRRPNDDNCGQVVRSLLAAGAQPCRDCSDGQTAYEGCAYRVTCDVLRQDRSCNC